MSEFKKTISENFVNNIHEIREIILKNMDIERIDVPDYFPSIEESLKYKIEIDRRTLKNTTLINIDFGDEFSIMIGIPPDRDTVYTFDHPYFPVAVPCPSLKQYFNL